MALTPIKDTETLKKYSNSTGDPPSGENKQSDGSISVFPNAPLDMPVETFKKGMIRREENRKVLLTWMTDNLVEGIDYGRIHLNQHCRYAIAGSPHLCSDLSHYSRPMLYQSGAERIIGVLGLTAHFPNLHQYELAAVHKQEISTVVLKCVLKTPSGRTIAEGAGASNVEQLNGDLHFAIKTSSRRAFVDSVIRISALSGVFNIIHQNSLTREGDCKNHNLPGTSVCHHSDMTSKSDCPTQTTDIITLRQKDFIHRIASRKGITSDGLMKECNALFKKDLDNLNKVEGSNFIQHLKA